MPIGATAENSGWTNLDGRSVQVNIWETPNGIDELKAVLEQYTLHYSENIHRMSKLKDMPNLF